MRRRPLALIALVLLLAGCSLDDKTTDAVAASEVLSSGVASTKPTIVTTESVGKPIPLPFENPFPNRWNDSNNGSPYEPCVSFSDEELERFHIDPTVIEDAAIVNGQGIRGCSWFMPNRFSLSNLVTNSRSLAEYRAGTVENVWKPDIVINGRTVGLFEANHERSRACSTYVQSFSAAVVTNVVTSTSDEGQKIDPCKLVEDFTRAYIDKIPN
ncbi:DUF3558 family protein [Williamsia muralis]|uniref:DUF3558 family protein n=1 Tax=Williamsia marianensis TaxID=85044 RepID=A0ABU4ES30_WILMA|nr:DUF3558 family protein [Williamsia muralis]MDV7134064.1 DUF3558 family protein [Williamsia muralis]